MKNYDILSYFDERGIVYQTSGKNVSKGWSNISCVFCGEHSDHLGVSNSGGFHCWVCGEKGGIPKLVQQIEGCSYKQALKILDPYKIDLLLETEEEESKVSRITFPNGMEHTLLDPHRRYLEERRFNPTELEYKYHLKSCWHLGGDFAYRIIIPIYMDGEVVSYTSRDVTGQDKTKYRHLSNEQSIVQIKNCIYNLDSVKDKCIILEGVFDVWRLGEGSVALLGTEYTHNQLHRLFQKKISKVFVMFDPDATQKAYKLASILTMFVPAVEVLELTDTDPADMDQDEADKLKKEIGF